LQTTPLPAPHAIPSSGGQQSEDGLVLDGGVQVFGAPSCKESGAEARIGGSIEAPEDTSGGGCEGSGSGGPSPMFRRDSRKRMLTPLGWL